MNTETHVSVRLTLFKHSKESFLTALDEAKISHGPIHMFSSNPQGSGLVEAITALSDAMPWNAIAKVVVAWIEARKSREIIIHTGTGQTIQAKGCSPSEVQKLLQQSTNVIVIDTKPVDQP
jgi:predicted ATP-grasp superfamily ATP-dependent carboligase